MRYPSTGSLVTALVVGTACQSCPAWSASAVYTAGMCVTYQNKVYSAKWWTQGNVPGTEEWGPWALQATTPTPDPTPTPTPTPTPAPTGFVFGPYKDVTINLNWNTNVLSTKVTGTLQPLLGVMPAKLNTVTWSFATGECGSENWGGVQGQALASANVQNFVNAGKTYILSTGGAAGSFTCGSDAGFSTFIQRYYSANLRGVDFDIEAGQSQTVINSLIQRVKVAQANYPNLRFSFTLATLGGSAAQNLGSTGVNVMNAIKAAGLSNYYVNLMVMDYGTAGASVCTLGSNGKCDMGQSAIRAAVSLHDYWGVPYNRIELTPMIGGNDTIDETFSLADVDRVTVWAKTNGLAGIHYWSLDRDTDCAPGYASPTCNTYGQAGNWGFANRFITDLGL
jgi:chitinase